MRRCNKTNPPKKCVHVHGLHASDCSIVSCLAHARTSVCTALSICPGDCSREERFVRSAALLILVSLAGCLLAFEAFRLVSWPVDVLTHVVVAVQRVEASAATAEFRYAAKQASSTTGLTETCLRGQAHESDSCFASCGEAFGELLFGPARLLANEYALIQAWGPEFLGQSLLEIMNCCVLVAFHQHRLAEGTG